MFRKDRVPNMKKTKRPTPRHIIVKMLKLEDNEIILKIARESQ